MHKNPSEAQSAAGRILLILDDNVLHFCGNFLKFENEKSFD